MAIVSSIRHHDITNDYNDGANSLKNFLYYAESISKGDAATARRVLENLNPLARKALSPLSRNDAVVEKLAAALRERGYAVDTNVGQSKFRCDLAVRRDTDDCYQLGILVDTDVHYANPNLLDRYLMQPSILRAFGWRFAMVLTKDWYHMQDDVLNRIEKLLQGQEAADEPLPEEEEVEVAEPIVMLKPQSPASSISVPVPVLVNTSSVTAAVASTGASTRHFEFVGGASRKFWEISWSGNSFTVRFGRMGTAGQSQTKSLADDRAARQEVENLIAEKLKKGYVEKH